MGSVLRAVDSPSPAIEQIALRLMARSKPLARQMVERYRDEIADYRLADEEFLLDDVQEVSFANVNASLRSIVGDDSAVQEAFEQTKDRAAARVRQGVSLNSLLHAARLFGQVLWEEVLEETDHTVPGEADAALEIAGAVMRYVDRLSTAAAEGYLNEVQSVWTDREVVRRDLLEDLISGRGDTDRVRSLGRSLRVELADRYVVIIAKGVDPPLDDNLDQPLEARVALRRIVEAARATLRPGCSCLLVGMRQGEVVALYPVKDPADGKRAEADVAVLATELAEHDIVVGVGGNHLGLEAIADSYAEARDAVEIGRLRPRLSGVRGRPVLFDQVLLDQVARSSPHADRILDRTVGPLLEYDVRRQAELVPTLRAYVAAGFNLTRSAEALSVHPNTVVYRLRRIRELCGRDPQNGEDLLLLILGLKLHELRGS